MTLKAVAPEVVPVGKAKLLLSGKSGVGKTMFSLDFPAPYLIDVEGGATLPQYREKLKKVGGVYFGKEQGSQDFQTVINEIRNLATEKHSFRTLIIDSFSALYNTAAALAEESVGNQFGRDKKEANRPTRQLLRALEVVPMNVLLICHAKDKWTRAKGGEAVYDGTTFDGYDKMEYVLDLWLEIEKTGVSRFMAVRKSRLEAFPEGAKIGLEYGKFADLYGKSILEKEIEPINMASPDQVAEMVKLVEIMNTPPEAVEKLLTKEGVDSWAELTDKQIEKYLTAAHKKIKEVSK